MSDCSPYSFEGSRSGSDLHPCRYTYLSAERRRVREQGSKRARERQRVREQGSKRARERQRVREQEGDIYWGHRNREGIT